MNTINKDIFRISPYIYNFYRKVLQFDPELYIEFHIFKYSVKLYNIRVGVNVVYHQS